MALAGELQLLGWDEWKTKLLEKRRRRWKEKVRDRVRVCLLTYNKALITKLGSDKEEDGECDEEEESSGSGEEKVEGENEAGVMREQKKGDEVVIKEEEVREEEGDNEVGREVKEDEEDNRKVIEEDKRVDVEEDEVEEREVMEEDERVDMEEDEVEEREVKEEDERVDVEEDEVVEVEEREVKEEEERVDMGEDEDEVEEREVKEEDERVDMEEDKVEEREVMEEDERVDVEEDEVEEAEEREAMEEDERVDVEQDEVGREVMKEEVEEVEEIEVMEAKEIEEEQEEKEFEELEELEDGLNEVKDEVDEEEDVQVREEEEQVEEEEEHQEQERIGQYNLTEPFREHSRRIEDENMWRNQETAEVQEEEKLSDSVESDEEESDEEDSDEEESDEEESDATESEDESSDFEGDKNEERAVEDHHKDPEELDVPDEKSLRTFKERNEEEDKTLLSEKFLMIQEEEFQVYKESVYDEEGDSADEEVDSDDEEVVKTFYKNGYYKEIFRTLTEFRELSILTDLTLRTANGKGFLVHSPVLAAVSSHVRENLGRRLVNKKKDLDVGLPKWSLYLGPEVEEVGVQAVVEFAYTGHISCLSRNTLQHIKAAAQSFGVPRVLNLCKDSPKYRWQKKEKRLTASEQMNISFKSINQLWMDRVGCDVILKAVDGTVHAHRIILAVCSDYFRSMFTLEMRESNQSCVTLPFILASELETMICTSYSGTLPLSWKCIYETTCIAHQLQYKPAMSLCHDFFQQEMTPYYCLDVASFAEAYDLAQILEVADDFVLRQFSKVACTSKFKDLPAKQLLKYLTSRSLCVTSELIVFKAVVKWIQARPKIRLKLAKDLMKTIHFPLMTFKEFKEVQSLDMWSDHQLADLYEAIFWDFCSNESQCRVYVPKENLVLIGGDQISEDLGTRSISGDLWFGNSLRNHTGVKKAMEWRKLGEMPQPERFCHEVAVFEGQLYVLGGKNYYGTGDILNCVHRYDPLQNSWESLAEMQEKRGSFSAVVLDGKIYAIGGQGDGEYIKTVERYCPIAKSWSFVQPLDLPVGGHVAKVLQGQIFISGGVSNDNLYLASMILYDPEKGSTFMSTMANPRARHCMEILGESLYVAGGITTNKHRNIINHLACEVYNPEADSWTAFPSLPVPHVGAGGAVLEEKFYVLGGYSEEDYTDTKMVHRYDPTSQKWENMGKMPGPNNDIRATLLCLPSHLRL